MSGFVRSLTANFPASWPVCAFDVGFRDATGGNPKVLTSDYLDAGALPVIDQGQAPLAGYVNDPDLVCHAPLPCILFGDHTRIFKLATKPFALGADGVKVLVPDSKLDVRFAYRYLAQVRLPEDLGYSRHFKYLREALVPLPPLAEQRRIADILDKADAIRRKRAEAVAHVDDLLRATFLDMFGDPITNPKGWPMASVLDLCASTQYGTAEKANTEGHGLPVLRMNNITYEGRIALDDLKWVELGDKERAKLDLQEGDVLFNRTNSRELVGKTAVWKQGGGYTFAGYLIRLRLSERALGDYVAAALNTPSGKRLLAAIAKPSINMANISGSDLARLPLAVPPLRLQKEYRTHAERLFEHRKRHELACTAANQLFDALVQRSFTGELTSGKPSPRPVQTSLFADGA